MTDPVSPSPWTAAVADADDVEPSPGTTWFRTREGRRFGVEIAVIVVVKLALLGVLWLVLIQPWARPPGKPITDMRQIYVPSTPAERHD